MENVPFRQLYKPSEPSHATENNPGAMLQRMHMSGRSVIEKQRVRWHRNRLMYLGEQHLRVVGSNVRTLAPADRLPHGRRRDTVNRLRSFTDGRVALLTSKKPPAQVMPDGNDSADLDASRVATRFVSAMWSEQYWDLDMLFRRVALAGEVDGICWVNVIYDPTAGNAVDFAVDMETGAPVTDRGKLEMLRDADPEGQELWKPVTVRQGEVCFRVVRGGALSIDPACRERWSDAHWVIESRIMGRAAVEREAGKAVAEILRKQGENKGNLLGTDPFPTEDYGQIHGEDNEGQETSFSNRENVVVRELFIKPGADWPQGAHIKWLDRAPDHPYIMEPWDDELPYFPYTPRPDGGHLLRSRGTVDDLVPVQSRFNRTLSQLGEWLDRVARPPLVLTGGGLRAETPRIFNEQGYVVVNPGFAPPQFMSVPSEPTSILTNHLAFLLEQMGEISSQTDASRGQAPVNQDSAAGLQTLIQQQEQQVSGTAGELIRTMQWTVSRGLKLVQNHYTVARTIQVPGGYDSAELHAFIGQKIRGATRYRIMGSLLPRSQAAQTQQFMQIMQAAQGALDFTPYLAAIVEGNMDELIERERIQENRQKRENMAMARIQRMGTPKLDEMWQDYNELLQKYAEGLAKIEETAMGQGMLPEQMLLASGIKKPSVEDVGMPVPKVEEFDRDGEHLSELDAYCASESFENYHSIVRAVFSRHREMHVEKLSRTMRPGPDSPQDDKGGAAPNRQKPEPGQPTQGAAQ